MKRMSFGSFLLLLFFVAGACAPKRAVLTATDPDSLRRTYAAALADAKRPTAVEIDRSLIALVPTAEALTWDDEGRILMVTWSKSKYFDYQPGQSFQLYGESWFTPAPFAKAFCTAYNGPDLDLRIKQYLGLPLTSENDHFIEIWVRPKDLFRPCPDPEIFDHECLVRIPLVDQGPTTEPDQPPWYCSEQPAAQVGGAFYTVNAAHLEWMCKSWTSRYTKAELYQNYPWTALGYTYDWGNPDDPVGGSEFVALGGAEVVFYDKVPTAVYCGREATP